MSIREAIEKKLNNFLNKPEIIKIFKEKDESRIVSALNNFLHTGNNNYRYDFEFYEDESEKDMLVFIQKTSAIDYAIEKECILNLNFELATSNLTHKSFVKSVEMLQNNENNYTVKKYESVYDLKIEYECLLSHWRYMFCRYKHDFSDLYFCEKRNFNLFREDEDFFDYSEKNIETKDLYNPVFTTLEKICTLYQKEQEDINEIIIKYLDEKKIIPQEELDLIQIKHDIDLSMLNEFYNYSFQKKSILSF